MEKENKFTLENGLTITGATLLTVEEAERLPEETRAIGRWWWLRSPGYDGDYAAIVLSDGSVDYGGDNVNDYIGAVRPALILDLKSSNLQTGDTFHFGGKDFEIISDTRALCAESIGYCTFREDWKADDANDYEVSDIRKFVEEWYQKQINLNQYIQKEENNMEISTIMDFGMFQEEVKKEILGYLPEEFEGADITIDKVNKNNISLTGIRILKKDSNISPLVYLDDFYARYTEGSPLPDIMKEIAGFFTMEIPDYVRNAVGCASNASGTTVEIKGVFPCLMNKEWNRELLDELVSSDIAPDLAVVYRAIVNVDENRMSSFLIKKETLSTIRKSEEKIHEMALEYVEKNGVVKNLFGIPVIKNCLGDEFPDDEETLDRVCQLFFAGFRNPMYGAGMIIDDSLLRNFREKYGDFYIFPSSIHELLLYPKTETDGSVDELYEMVRQVNEKQVAVDERLSDNVYEYDFDKKMLVYAEQH